MQEGYFGSLLSRVKWIVYMPNCANTPPKSITDSPLVVIDEYGHKNSLEVAKEGIPTITLLPNNFSHESFE